MLVEAESLGDRFDVEPWVSNSRTVEFVPENVDFHQRGYADYQASLAAARGLWRL